MSFEGPLCGCLNFYNEYGEDFDNRIINGFSAILGRYGLYYEMGEHWNLSCYPIHIHGSSEAKTQPTKPEDTTITFRGEHTRPSGISIPKPLLLIQEVWREKADAYGDVGSCVLGAGFHFTYRGQDYFMPPISRWQGSGSWEHFVQQVTAMLEEIGATNIRYNYGNMD